MADWQRIFRRRPAIDARRALIDQGPVKVILGLGNPGDEYSDTRHNVGWWVVDDLRERWHFDAWRKDGASLTSSGSIGTTKVRLVKPQTFMNLSGQALRPFLKREGWAAKNDLLVVVDEVQIPVGTWRYRADGSPGGHNGLKDVERAVGGREYARLRVGVGPEDPARRRGDLADYVLGRFGKAEASITREILPVVAEAIEAWIREGSKGALDVQSRKARTAE